MFKFVILFACFAAVALTAPTEREEHEIVPIVKSEINKNDDGSYQLIYEGGDGTAREEKAVVMNAGTENEALEVKGSYKYINEDGEEVEVFYTAGVNGFVPYGKTINEEISAVAEAAKDLPKEEEHVKFEKKHE
ncbi:endocuticle structural protein SgAbd-6-like [Cochliomyia hominivorax]